MSSRFLAAVTVVAGLALATAPAIAQQPYPGGPQSFAAPTLPPAPSGPGVLGETPVSVDAMVAGINSRLGDAVGYAYTIARNGRVVVRTASGGTPGRRRHPAFTPTTRLELMSVTKKMTAIALLKLLQAEGVRVDSPIARWLPLQWRKAGGSRGRAPTPITFRHLLTHNSGVNQAIAAAPAGSGVGTLVGPASALRARRDAQSSADQLQERQLRADAVLIPGLQASGWSPSSGPTSGICGG